MDDETLAITLYCIVDDWYKSEGQKLVCFPQAPNLRDRIARSSPSFCSVFSLNPANRKELFSAGYDGIIQIGSHICLKTATSTGVLVPFWSFLALSFGIWLTTWMPS